MQEFFCLPEEPDEEGAISNWPLHPSPRYCSGQAACKDRRVNLKRSPCVAEKAHRHEVHYRPVGITHTPSPKKVGEAAICSLIHL
jgi:hypothetical protein